MPLELARTRKESQSHWVEFAGLMFIAILTLSLVAGLTVMMCLNKLEVDKGLGFITGSLMPLAMMVYMHGRGLTVKNQLDSQTKELKGDIEDNPEPEKKAPPKKHRTMYGD